MRLFQSVAAGAGPKGRHTGTPLTGQPPFIFQLRRQPSPSSVPSSGLIFSFPPLLSSLLGCGDSPAFRLSVMSRTLPP